MLHCVHTCVHAVEGLRACEGGWFYKKIWIGNSSILWVKSSSTMRGFMVAFSSEIRVRNLLRGKVKGGVLQLLFLRFMGILCAYMGVCMV